MENANEEKRYKIVSVVSEIDKLSKTEKRKSCFFTGVTAIAVASGLLLGNYDTVRELSGLFTVVGATYLVAHIFKLMELKTTKKDLERLKTEGIDTIGRKYEGKFFGVLPSVINLEVLDENIIQAVEEKEKKEGEMHR